MRTMLADFAVPPLDDLMSDPMMRAEDASPHKPRRHYASLCCRGTVQAIVVTTCFIARHFCGLSTAVVFWWLFAVTPDASCDVPLRAWVLGTAIAAVLSTLTSMAMRLAKGSAHPLVVAFASLQFLFGVTWLILGTIWGLETTSVACDPCLFWVCFWYITAAYALLVGCLFLGAVRKICRRQRRLSAVPLRFRTDSLAT